MTATGRRATGADHRRADRRVALEEERDLLLRSLDDLDEEYESGELDRADYESLRDDYTARAASVLHRLAGTASGGEGAVSGGEGTASGGEGAVPGGEGAPVGRRRRVPLLATVGVLAIFGAGAGLLLARTAGERGLSDQLTGGIDESARAQVVRCQELGSTGGDLLGSLQCFDEILADDPTDPEALAYRGWYLILATGVLGQASGDELASADVAELVTSGLDYLTRSVEADPSYPDPLAFRAALYDRLGQREQVCGDVEALRALAPPQFFLDQTAGLAGRNGC